MTTQETHRSEPDVSAAPGKRPRWLLPAGAAAVLAIGGTIAGVALTGPGSITAHGTVQACVYGGDIAGGTQVTVTDLAGKVIGTGTLAEDTSRAAQQLAKTYDDFQAGLGSLGDAGPGMSVFTFTVPVAGGQPRYGVNVGHDRGTVWYSGKEMTRGPAISVGCGQ